MENRISISFSLFHLPFRYDSTTSGWIYVHRNRIETMGKIWDHIRIGLDEGTLNHIIIFLLIRFENIFK